MQRWHVQRIWRSYTLHQISPGYCAKPHHKRVLLQLQQILTLWRHENKNAVVLKCSPDRSITLFSKSESFHLTAAILKINDLHFQCSRSAAQWVQTGFQRGDYALGVHHKAFPLSVFGFLLNLQRLSVSPSPLCSPFQLPIRLLSISTSGHKFHMLL